MTTKKQHYIPRMILKNFTYFRIPMRKPLIYYFDKQKNIECLIDIKNVCRKNYLYEFKDENNNNIYTNLNENYFSRLESKWAEIIKKIKNDDNLNDNDISQLCLLIFYQLVRTPEIIKYGENFMSDHLSLKQFQARNYSLIYSITPKYSEKIIKTFFSKIPNHYLKIYKTEAKNDVFLLNKTRPVLVLKDDLSFYFPIDAHYCLVLKNEDTQMYVSINKETLFFINKETFLNGTQFLGSSSIKEKFEKEHEAKENKLVFK